jgi:hypothetical protein
VRRAAWLLRGDIIVDRSKFRLPFEYVIRRRDRNAVGRYGMGIPRRWLLSIGIQLDRHHALATNGIPSSHPDFFDHSTRIAYEVKTGRHSLNPRSLSQIITYDRALKTRQAKLIAYLNVAFEGKVGLTPRYREELRKRGFRLLMLR